MKTLPTLETKIKEIAERKLENDINNLHMILYGSEDDDKYFKLIKGVSIAIEVSDGKMIHPYLCQLFQSAPVIDAIKEQRLPEYIEREIESILKKS
jgi:hypothetical protein